MTIQQRKRDHIEICVDENVSYRKSAGFEKYDFIHNALPEINPRDVSTTASLLGRDFSFPLFISSMTGGYSEAGSINGMIAAFCQKNNLPFGVGSQRVMLENREERAGFRIAREKAPDSFIAANIGGAQLVGGMSREQIGIMIDTIRADAVIVHLNLLQELVQTEGDHHFRGVEEGISTLVSEVDIPVIVKETGAGISRGVAERLLRCGVRVIDVAGAGGTSWSRVENLRNSRREERPEGDTGEEVFEEWGIPTADCIEDVMQLRTSHSFEMIASGGIRTSLDMIKALALGADFTAAAQPVISALKSGRGDALDLQFSIWKRQFVMAMTLLGCRTVAELGRKHLRRI